MHLFVVVRAGTPRDRLVGVDDPAEFVESGLLILNRFQLRQLPSRPKTAGESNPAHRQCRRPDRMAQHRGKIRRAALRQPLPDRRHQPFGQYRDAVLVPEIGFGPVVAH
ncbi:hypothetical protein SDC9_183544 [bioreactor metagenome]|uniref:Uncharacterized protein n=1 Tax=bioreactor metagenome TaxID=1076179 RepID=A0A645HD35_9ZZZZ